MAYCWESCSSRGTLRTAQQQSEMRVKRPSRIHLRERTVPVTAQPRPCHFAAVLRNSKFRSMLGGGRRLRWIDRVHLEMCRECFLQTGRTETQNRRAEEKHIQYLGNRDAVHICLLPGMVELVGPVPEALCRLSGSCS